MDEIFYLLRQEGNDLSDFNYGHEEFVDEYKREFTLLQVRVYNSCLIFFELKGIPKYIEDFKEIYTTLLSDKMGADVAYVDISGIEESKITKTFRQALYPFRAFATGDERHLTGLAYLENILQSTNRILTDRDAKPAQESDVYSNVKLVIEATFSNSKASFPGGKHKIISQMATCYIPDILIPDLNCAIEYKFAISEKALNTTMDQVLADVQGYSNDSIYKLFYAVFYVKTGIIAKSRFEQIWQSKSFPSNWKPIFVEGPIFPKTKKTITSK